MTRYLLAALMLGALATTLPAEAQPAPAAKATKRVKARKPAPPPPEVPLPPAEGEQNAAAAMVHFGDYACELNQSVKVAMNPKYDGYIDVQFGAQRFTMKPVLSSTGALRLEDVKGQTMMLQIAHKSMLMDVKAGRRLVDECAHEKQLAAKLAAEGQAPSGLLSGDTGAGPAAPTTAAPAQK